jgi:magnesium transporter
MDTRRAVSLTMQPYAQRRPARGGAPDPARHRLVDSHSTFLFDKINFLMNATVGFININQNKRS